MKAAFVLFALVAAACGSKSPGPITPTPTETIPNYAGTWTGTYMVTACTNSGFFLTVAFCAQTMSTTAPVTFTLSQSDRAVTGNFQLGTLDFPTVSGTVTTDSTLTLSKSIVDGAFPIE